MASDVPQPTSTRQLVQSQPNRLVWKGKVTVELEGIQELRRLELNPSLDQVNSLIILNAEELSRHNFSQADANLWISIVSFWSPRLESLDVDVLQIPPDARLLQLLSSPGLRKLSCTYVKLFETPITTGDHLAISFELPSCLLHLEEINIFKFRFLCRYTILFLSQLATSRNLKRLVVRVDYDASLIGVRRLIDAKRDDAEFQVSIFHDVSVSDQLDDRYVALVRSVAASSSKIRILELNEKKVSCLEEKVGVTVAEKFFSCVEVISMMNDGVERLKNYPNLKDLRRLDFGGGNLGAVEFPPQLERLRIIGDIRLLLNLPWTLTDLSLEGYNCTVNELLVSLDAFSGTCPLLRNLVIHWSSTSIRNHNARPQFAAQTYATYSFNKFPQLKCLEFHASFSDGDPIDAAREILLEGFQLPQLTLHDLELRGEIRMPNETLQLKLDSFILSPIVAGTLKKTLRNVKIEWVSEDAECLLQMLTSVAAANNGREETGGAE